MKFYRKCRNCGISSSICFLSDSGFCSVFCEKRFFNRKHGERKMWLFDNNTYYSVKISGDKIITTAGTFHKSNCRYAHLGDCIIFVPNTTIPVDKRFLERFRDIQEKSDEYKVE